MFNVFKNWLAQVENESGRKLKCLESDNRGEYYNYRVKEFCVSRGIRRVKTTLKNPHQNGVAEHMNRIILERAKSMRIHAKVPKQFWTNTVNTTVYLINRLPSIPLNCGILEKTWMGKEVNLNHMCIIGCISYVHVDLHHRCKLEPKSRDASSLGMVQVSTTIDFEIQKIERSLGIRMWYSMIRKCTRTCLWRGAIRRRIPKWHLGALRNSKILQS